MVDKLRRKGGVRCRMLFLEADTRAIISRYKETRRSHPLCAGEIFHRGGRPAGAGSCWRRCGSRQTVAGHVGVFHRQAAQRADLFGGGDTQQALNVSVMSFGFKNGLPLEADLVFDVRFLPNPYYVPELKHLTGLQRAGAGICCSPPRRRGSFWSGWSRCWHFCCPVPAGGADGAGHRGGLHRRAAPLHGHRAPSGQLYRGTGLSGVGEPSGYFR